MDDSPRPCHSLGTINYCHDDLYVCSHYLFIREVLLQSWNFVPPTGNNWMRSTWMRCEDVTVLATFRILPCVLYMQCGNRHQRKDAEKSIHSLSGNQHCLSPLFSTKWRALEDQETALLCLECPLTSSLVIVWWEECWPKRQHRPSLGLNFYWSTLITSFFCILDFLLSPRFKFSAK